MQGGHALTALYTEGAMPLHKVTCVPRGHALGVVRHYQMAVYMVLMPHGFTDLSVAGG